MTQTVPVTLTSDEWTLLADGASIVLISTHQIYGFWVHFGESLPLGGADSAGGHFGRFGIPVHCSGLPSGAKVYGRAFREPVIVAVSLA